MEFREMMWDLFISTGNLDAYLAYRACVCPDASPGGHIGMGLGAYYQEEKPPGALRISIQAGGE